MPRLKTSGAIRRQVGGEIRCMPAEMAPATAPAAAKQSVGTARARVASARNIIPVCIPDSGNGVISNCVPVLGYMKASVSNSLPKPPAPTAFTQVNANMTTIHRLRFCGSRISFPVSLPRYQVPLLGCRISIPEARFNPFRGVGIWITKANDFFVMTYELGHD